jgi:lipid-A-disaccharide synthase
MSNNNSDSLRIALSCGELSGDEHAASLIHSILSINSTCQIKGMGGRNCRSAGMQTIIDSETSASVMGVSAVIGSLGKILKAYSELKELLRTWKPDILIIIDYPDFNMRLARYAKSLGIKTFCFIAPQVWAWRSGRVEFFKKHIDYIVVLFPFEMEFLKKRGYDNVSFLGHPLVDKVKKYQNISRADFCAELGISPSKKILTVFPGSRKQELKNLLQPISDGLRIFSKRHPDVQILVNLATNIDDSLVQKHFQTIGTAKIIRTDSLKLLATSDAALLKSGTSNLQSALLNCPFSMIYIASGLFKIVATLMLKIKQYSIVNILKANTIHELIQDNVTPENISNECEKILFDDDLRKRMKSDFQEILTQLTPPNDSNLTDSPTTSDNLAKLILKIAR